MSNPNGHVHVYLQTDFEGDNGITGGAVAVFHSDHVPFESAGDPRFTAMRPGWYWHRVTGENVPIGLEYPSGPLDTRMLAMSDAASCCLD